ncbi:MAG: sigma-70 family RNA polymerase sigma factor [Gemmatimonadetes bacterium]|nr:sigma-70 family RNA polymerase sigma factor [Gemmatimonadota bacterium]
MGSGSPAGTTWKELDDRTLVELARTAGSGDFRAFDELVKRHRAKVLANCRYMTRSSADSEDLAQEVFVCAYFGLPKFRGDAAFGTWVGRIKVNRCLNYLEKQKRAPDQLDVDAPGMESEPDVRTQPAGSKELEALDERGRIAAVLDEMSDTLRVALLMRDLDEFSYREIADTLGLGLSAAKMRVKRGRAEFRDRYEARYGLREAVTNGPEDPA